MKNIVKIIAVFALALSAAACQKEKIAVESITLNKTDLELEVGKSETLTATVLPDNASDKTIEWSSSAADVVSVEGGVVKALKSGEAVVTAKSGNVSATCKVKAIVKIASITMDQAELLLVAGKTATLVATVLPEDATDKTLEWLSSNPDVATVADGKVTALKPGTAVIAAKAAGQFAECLVSVYYDYPYVDLGLSVNWATWNIGATDEAAYGDLFAWGETQTKEVFDWRHAGDYKWGIYDEKAVPDRGMTKYNSTDGKTLLEPEDDAATVNWGGLWRMPTKEECAELVSKCDFDWEKRGNVWGYKVTGPNGNTIFLPAAGRSAYDYDLRGRDEACWYWSATSNVRKTGAGPAYLLVADEYGPDTMDDGRVYGQSVRPVCPKGAFPPCSE